MSVGVVPLDSKVSSIVNSWKGNDEALEWVDYRGLNLLEHVMSGRKDYREASQRENVNIDNMESRFMQGCGTILMQYI